MDFGLSLSNNTYTTTEWVSLSIFLVLLHNFVFIFVGFYSCRSVVVLYYKLMRFNGLEGINMANG